MNQTAKRRIVTAAIVLVVLGAFGYTAHTLNLLGLVRQLHGG
jgi:hypothetical protein